MEAPQIGISPIDVAALGRGGDKQGLKAHVWPRELHEFVGSEVVQVAYEALVLGDHPQQIGMCDRSPDLEWATGTTIELPKFRVCVSKDIDGRPPIDVPALQRK